MIKKGAASILILSCATTAIGENSSNGEWRIAYGSAAARGLVPICFYRDKATAGFLSRGDWKASIGSDRAQCDERMTADLKERILHLAVPGFLPPGGYQAGQADAYCPPNRTPTGYTACTSEFFMRTDSTSYRVVSPHSINRIVRESSVVAALEARITEEKRAQEAEARTAYLRAFEEAVTLDRIASFEAAYAGRDPDGLIAKLADRKAELERGVYRERYASARTSKELLSFISDYSGRDPDELVPEARKRLAVAESREAQEKEAAERRSHLASLERQIAWCKQRSVAARDAIARENEIGRVSGYVDKLTLRQAGEIIVACEAAIPRDYAEYLRLGGGRSLESIQ